MVPFLKWAGGKRWLVSNHSDLFPAKFNYYLEPFVGSGAVYFHLLPKKAVLGDTNIDLITTYKAIKTGWQKVEKELRKHHYNHSKFYYYYIRSLRPRTPHTLAARFIYLNRTCWNGLYRVNRMGQFNVPIGTKTDVLLDADDFGTTARILRNAKLVSKDFENVIDRSESGDFLFIDPPYTVKHNYNGFIKYNDLLFKWEDQERLQAAIVRAKRRRVIILLTNANHKSVRKLYQGIGEKKTLIRNSVLAADSSKRKECEELIIRVN